MKARAIKKLVAHSLGDIKARETVCLDLSGISGFTDYLFVATATSARHAKAVAEQVLQDVKREGMTPLGTEGMGEAQWILIDLGGVVVNIMREETRRYYDLEGLWEDMAPAENAVTSGRADV